MFCNETFFEKKERVRFLYIEQRQSHRFPYNSIATESGPSAGHPAVGGQDLGHCVRTRNTDSLIHIPQQTSESVARVLDRPFGLCMRGILKRKDQGQDPCRLKTDSRVCGVEGSWTRKLRIRRNPTRRPDQQSDSNECSDLLRRNGSRITPRGPISF
jgi:hypothetical protein